MASGHVFHYSRAEVLGSILKDDGVYLKVKDITEFKDDVTEGKLYTVARDIALSILRGSNRIDDGLYQKLLKIDTSNVFTPSYLYMHNGCRLPSRSNHLRVSVGCFCKLDNDEYVAYKYATCEGKNNGFSIGLDLGAIDEVKLSQSHIKPRHRDVVYGEYEGANLIYNEMGKLLSCLSKPNYNYESLSAILSTALQKCRPFIKSSNFCSEKEYRFAVYDEGDEPTNGPKFSGYLEFPYNSIRVVDFYIVKYGSEISSKIEYLKTTGFVGNIRIFNREGDRFRMISEFPSVP